MAKSNASVAPQAQEERARKVCPITLEEFKAHAKPISAVINGEQKAVAPKEFSTGSFGFYLTGKQTVIINGVPVECQVATTITCIGSKPE